MTTPIIGGGVAALSCSCCGIAITDNEWSSCYECSAPICGGCADELPQVPYMDCEASCDDDSEDEETWNETVCGKCQGLT